MQILRALTLSIGDIKKPIITTYDLGLILFSLYHERSYKGEPLPHIQKALPEAQDFSRVLRELTENGIIENPPQYPSSTYSLLGKRPDSVEDAVCAIDPFCYVSHLSAMAFHGITDRAPTTLFLSTPSPTDWKAYSLQAMEKKLGPQLDAYINSGLPKLQKHQFNRLGKTHLHWYNSKHLGAYKNIANRTIRVSTIGRTFLDMLRNPELCGGMNHVLQVFENHGGQYLRLITDEIDRHGKAIDKVRAGYILEERLNLTSTTIDSWTQFAQRGGSRKLDPSEEYVPQWSEKWCISLNTPENAL